MVVLEATYVCTVDGQHNINESQMNATVAFIEATCKMTVHGQNYFYLNMFILVVD